MNNDKLEACPFCGSDDLHLSSNGIGSHYVTCEQCGAEGPAAPNTRGAQEAWSTRSSIPKERLHLNQTITDGNASSVLTDMLMECAERFGNFPGAKVDQRAWKHLLTYAPMATLIPKERLLEWISKNKHEWQFDDGDGEFSGSAVFVNDLLKAIGSTEGNGND